MEIGDLTLQNQSDQLPKPYISSFTRDTSIGSGTQSITGLGFKPRAVIFISTINSTDFASWGFDTLSLKREIHSSGDSDDFAGGGASSIRVTESAGSIDLRANITSIDSDGFTLTWTLVSGSPTGTLNISFIAFK